MEQMNSDGMARWTKREPPICDFKKLNLNEQSSSVVPQIAVGSPQSLMIVPSVCKIVRVPLLNSLSDSAC